MCQKQIDSMPIKCLMLDRRLEQAPGNMIKLLKYKMKFLKSEL